MAVLDHWHPILLSKKLKNKPVGVKVWDEELVLFRTHDGVGALKDKCPHRFSRLSTGFVVDGCVQCPYHLWTFDHNGQGKSPCNPRMKPRATPFEALDYAGYIWVKKQGVEAVRPHIDDKGPRASKPLHFIGYLQDTIKAPMELVLDNFTEIEHSANNHFLFAFDEVGITQVTPFVELKEKHIHIVYSGPQRSTPWWSFAGAIGFGSDTRINIDLEIYFDPVYFIYDITWHDPKTDAINLHVREYAYLVPRSPTETEVIHYFWNGHPIFSPMNPLRFLFLKFFMKQSMVEFHLDKHIIQEVAHNDPRNNLKGMALGIFDRSLRDARRYMKAHYYGPGEDQKALGAPPDLIALPAPRANMSEEAAPAAASPSA